MKKGNFLSHKWMEILKKYITFSNINFLLVIMWTISEIQTDRGCQKASADFLRNRKNKFEIITQDAFCIFSTHSKLQFAFDFYNVNNLQRCNSQTPKRQNSKLSNINYELFVFQIHSTTIKIYKKLCTNQSQNGYQ